MHSLDNETVLKSSRKLGRPAEHSTGGNEKRVCRSTFEFWSLQKRSKFNCELVHYIYLCSLGHESIAAIMTSRLKNLSVVARYWGDGDIKVRTTSLY